jgi:hypothetical protein
LSIFKNVNFAQKQEAFELQINVNHRQYLEAFIENFPNFNVKFNNFSKDIFHPKSIFKPG